MPQVASALKNHAANRPLVARPAPASDRAPSSPFASLLDDNAPAPKRPPQSATADHGARAARSDQAQQPAKSTDDKAAKAKDDASSADANAKDAKDTKTGKTDANDQAANDGKAVTDAKIAKPTNGKDVTPVNDGKPADGKDATPVNDGKPADGNNATPMNDGKLADALVAADIAVAPPADPMPTITPADAIATVLAPTTGTVAPGLPAADKAATVVTPVKADALAALKTGNAKADNDAALTVKAAAQPHGEFKPQGLAGEAKPQGLASDAADKDAIAQARGELARGELTNTAHHAATPQAQAALAADAIATAPNAATDAAPPIALTAPLQTTAPTGPNPAASVPMPQTAAIPFAGVAIEIAGKAAAGKNHFEIRLDPPELGRIEVRLDVDRDGNVTSRMIADRADTLDLLRRDASGLERALQDAGLKTSDNGLQFSLRDQSAQQQHTGRTSEIARLVVEDDMLPTIDVTPRSYSRLAGLGSGVDIQV